MDCFAPAPDAHVFETTYEPDQTTQKLVSYPKPGLPVIATGIHGIDMNQGHGIRLNTSGEDIKEFEFKANINTWSDSKLYSAGMSYVRVTDDNCHGFQAGRFDASSSNKSTQIKFKYPYSKPPSVVVWISGLDLGNEKNWRLKTEAKDITSDGFTITMDTWYDTVWHSASANWIALPSDLPNVVAGTYNTEQVRKWNAPTKETHGKLTFLKKFDKAPTIITALSSIDVKCGSNIRIGMPITDVTGTGLSWGLDTWADSTLYSATAWYLAFDQKYTQAVTRGTAML